MRCRLFPRVQIGIGAAQQLSIGLAVPVLRDSHRYRELHVERSPYGDYRISPANGALHGRPRLMRLSEVTRQQRQKLVASPTAYHDRLCGEVPELLPYNLQHLVAACMTPLIVDLLELVQIQQEGAKRSSGGDQLPQLFVSYPAVRQSGESIRIRGFFRPVQTT